MATEGPGTHSPSTLLPCVLRVQWEEETWDLSSEGTSEGDVKQVCCTQKRSEKEGERGRKPDFYPDSVDNHLGTLGKILLLSLSTHLLYLQTGSWVR